MLTSEAGVGKGNYDCRPLLVEVDPRIYPRSSPGKSRMEELDPDRETAHPRYADVLEGRDARLRGHPTCEEVERPWNPSNAWPAFVGFILGLVDISVSPPISQDCCATRVDENRENRAPKVSIAGIDEADSKDAGRGLLARSSVDLGQLDPGNDRSARALASSQSCSRLTTFSWAVAAPSVALLASLINSAAFAVRSADSALRVESAALFRATMNAAAATTMPTIVPNAPT